MRRFLAALSLNGRRSGRSPLRLDRRQGSYDLVGARGRGAFLDF
jgi:hypothetical protein